MGRPPRHNYRALRRARSPPTIWDPIPIRSVGPDSQQQPSRRSFVLPMPTQDGDLYKKVRSEIQSRLRAEEAQRQKKQKKDASQESSQGATKLAATNMELQAAKDLHSKLLQKRQNALEEIQQRYAKEIPERLRQVEEEMRQKRAAEEENPTQPPSKRKKADEETGPAAAAGISGADRGDEKVHVDNSESASRERTNSGETKVDHSLEANKKDVTSDNSGALTAGIAAGIKLESEAKVEELQKLKGELDSLNQTKSQMVWLLKQVITAEKKRKDVRKKKENTS